MNDTTAAEGEALKAAVAKPQDTAPWLGHFDEEERGLGPHPAFHLLIQNKPVQFDLAQIAITIGCATVALKMARGEPEESWYDVGASLDPAKALAVLVRDMLVKAALDRGVVNAMDPNSKPPIFDENDIYQAIEAVLLRNELNDVLRAVIMRREFRMAKGHQIPSGIRIMRRNGDLSPWNTNKVEHAVRRAFISVEEASAPSVEVAAAVELRAKAENRTTVHIEEVQDWVEESLMRLGHYKVARAYIVYREARSRLRGAGVPTKRGLTLPRGTEIDVLKSDGSTAVWDGEDLSLRMQFAMAGLDLCLSADEIDAELRRSIFNGITEDQLKQTIILNAKMLMQRDADFDKFAGRILLTYIYEEVLDWDIVEDGVGKLRQAHKVAFRKNLRRAVKIERLDPKLLDMELGVLSLELDPTADMELSFMGISALYERYFLIDKTGKAPKRLETPQFFWMRVAMGLYAGDKKAEKQAIELYGLYKNRLFCSSTPTLFNSGTLHPQLSSCYLYNIMDSMESITMKGVHENAQLCKWAGGLGGSWTQVRGMGSRIHSTNGESQGVIPFIRVHNALLSSVNQGGKRKGSGCVYLEVWHNDILDFLQLRVNTGDERRRAHETNTACWIPDLFMQRLEARKEWSLFRSNEVPDLHELYGQAFKKRYEEYEALAAAGKIWTKKMPAVELWRQMFTMLFTTGNGWMCWKDPCNVRSPQDHAGVVHSSNLCTEITLNTSEEETAVCNLGSIVLENHLLPGGEFDLHKLRNTVRVAVRALDRVIDVNFYPVGPAQYSNLKHRPIGLGVMGLQYALFKKGIDFASQEAVEFNDEFMEQVAYFAYEASSDLAVEKGCYSTFEGSKWARGLLPQDTLTMLEAERGAPVDVPKGGKLDWEVLRAKIKSQGMRNSNVLAIAPTATISIIVGSSPCIEPLYKNAFVKSNLGGEFFALNRYLVQDLKKHGLWTDHIRGQLKYHNGELGPIAEIPEELKTRYLTAFGIDWHFVIDAAARRQKWIDQSQSVNLWISEGVDQVLSQMYRAAWRKGLKTTYYLKTLAASDVEQADVQVQKQMSGAVADSVAETAAFFAEQKRKAESGEECEACT